MDELTLKVVEKYKNNFKGLIDVFEVVILSKHSSQKTTKKFVEKIILKSQKSIYERTNSTGIIYEISNQFNCKSYIIGTLHLNLPVNKIMETKIQESSELFVEVFSLYEQLHCLMSRILPWYKQDIFDLSLINQAQIHKVPVHGLESYKDSVLPKSVVAKAKSNPYDFPVTNKLRLHYPFFESEMVEAWHNGDPSIFNTLREYEHPLINKYDLDERNKNWLFKNNLLSKLETAKKPISIAVGSFHLFGEAGLLEAFQDSGTLKIKQIS